MEFVEGHVSLADKQFTEKDKLRPTPQIISNQWVLIQAGYNMNDFYQAALNIAKKKLFSDLIPGKLHSPRLGTGGGFVDIFLWDTVFCSHWAKYHMDEFPMEDSIDNFYLCQEPDGFISRQIRSDGKSKWSKAYPVSFAPPLLSWLELDLYVGGFQKNRLERVYPALCKLHEFNKKWRRADGLYFSDMWGCGMDDIPRWDDQTDTDSPGINISRAAVLEDGEYGDQSYKFMTDNPHCNFNWNRQIGWVDTNCQIAFDCLNLSKIATILKRTQEARNYRNEHDALAALINEKMFHEKCGFYCDCTGTRLINHMHIGGFWALISEVATPERANRLMEHLCDPETFGLPCGVPGIARNDSCFGLDERHYWTGPAWCPTEYMVLCGVRTYQEETLAKELATRFYNATYRIWEKTGTIWENYSPMQCEQPSPAAGRDFCGWSALAPITIFLEFVNKSNNA